MKGKAAIAALAALGAGAFGLLFLRSRWPDGQAPLDDWTPDLRDDATKSRVKASSGASYTVTTSRPNADDKVFSAAVRDDGAGWVSFAHHRPTGTRELYRAFAFDDANVQPMLADWGLV